MAFSPINRLYCRAGTLDSIENGTSSFLQELKDISMITNQLANLKYNRAKSAEELLKVMVFFDELGINTSIEQGLPLMWSICEYLMSLEKVGVVVATHNHFLN
jgi:DNA mismatch repair ATPase MutS